MNKFFIIGFVIIGIGILAGATFYLSRNSSITPSSQKTETNFTHMAPTDFQKAISSGEYKLIDIRTEEEYAAGHIKDAEQNDFYQTEKFNSYLETLDKNQKYLIYCRSGNRSGQALEIMKQKGFLNASDLAGGISKWTGAGLPITTQ
jgi:rhodanese-related sulfurtransferase